MVGRYLRATPGFFCCQRDYSVVGKRSLAMLLFSYQGSTPAVPVRKQGREELRKLRRKPMEAHLPYPVGNLRKAVVENLLAS